MKMIIYKFYSDTCEPCKVLSEELKPVEHLLTNVNKDNIDNLDLFLEFNVKKIPFIVFVDPETRAVLKRLSKGSDDRITLQKFEQTLNGILEENGTI